MQYFDIRKGEDLTLSLKLKHASVCLGDKRKQLTVSSAQYRFVAIIPVGPRFNHPQTYKPFSINDGSPEVSLRTRPLTFGTTPRRDAMQW